MRKFKNVFFLSNINVIGGIETFLFEIAKKYSDNYDITVFYRTGDKNQIKRLRELVRVEKWNGKEKIKCDVLVSNCDTTFENFVEAPKKYTVIHADFRKNGIVGEFDPNKNYISVSETAKNGFYETTKIESEVCYNPLTIKKPKKLLKLVSATRLTKEKGKERMIKLAEVLEKANIPFIWLVFTNDTEAIKNDNIVFLKPRLDILPYVQEADYLVQLSDTEAWSYSINEALSLGVPIITTDMPMIKELGDNLGYVLPFDMSEIPVDKIYKKKPKVDFILKSDNWEKYLKKSKSNYRQDRMKIYKVKATSAYKDLNLSDKELNKIPDIGEKFEVSYDRLQELLNNKYNVEFVEIVKNGN